MFRKKYDLEGVCMCGVIAWCVFVCVWYVCVLHGWCEREKVKKK